MTELPYPKIKSDSYSSLVLLKDCGFKYKLKYVDGNYPDEDTFATVFGKYLHTHMQTALKNRFSVEERIGAFNLEWDKFVQENKKLLKPNENPEDFKIIGLNSISRVVEEFDENLKYKEVIAAEHRLIDQPLPEKYSYFLQGFIDLVLIQNDGKYIIADIKTCSSAYMFKQYQDKYKEYQLTLYKYLYATEKNIPLDMIETYFVLVEKNPKSKQPIQFSRVSSGKVKIQNCLEWVDNSFRLISNQKFLKNRTNCHAYGKTCPFYDTDLCRR